jgi:holo-ACP synthase
LAQSRNIFEPLSGLADLRAILGNREDRVTRREEMLGQYASPLVSFSVNMPGASKDNIAARCIFREGMASAERLITGNGWIVLAQRRHLSPAGPEALACVQRATPCSLKQAMLLLEENHPLGRLFDFDVLTPEGFSISRVRFGKPMRRCFLCGNPAAFCAREQRHSLDALQNHIRELLLPFLPCG